MDNIFYTNFPSSLIYSLLVGCVSKVICQHFLPLPGGQQTLPAQLFPHFLIVLRLLTLCWLWTCLSL